LFEAGRRMSCGRVRYSERIFVHAFDWLFNPNETLLLLDDTQNIPGNSHQRAAILRQRRILRRRRYGNGFRVNSTLCRWRISCEHSPSGNRNIPSVYCLRL